MQITPEKAEDESNHTIAAACTPFPKPTKTMSISCGLENMYEKVFKYKIIVKFRDASSSDR